MEIWLMTAAVNLAVGALVGLCGVAGFLLPIFYTAVLGMNVSEGLALSFAAFIVAGALGAWNYQKAGNLDVKFGLKLSCGSLIGAICSMSGAGGPILVMPLLVVFGIPIRTAIGVALFNSVFIGIPAVIGYAGQCDLMKLLPILLIALVTQGIGVYFGSRNAAQINQVVLKRGIAIFSILIAVWKLIEIF